MGLLYGANLSAEDRNACSEDIVRFCKDVSPGRLTVMECLEKHETELTDACKSYEQMMGGSKMERREAVRMERMEAAQAQARLQQSCKDEVAKFCTDMKPGTGGIAACLTGNESKLSSTCREALFAAKEEERQNK